MRGDVSSQFLTALLMALPLARRARRAIEVDGELISKPYVEITLNLMRRFGVEVARDDWRTFTVPAAARYRSPGEIYVEGDASSASYFLAAGAIARRRTGARRGRRARQHPGRRALRRRAARMGAQRRDRRELDRGRRRSAAMRTRKLRAIELDFNHIPDAAMTLAVLALFADGPSTLRNIASWRVKETDRIAAMATELRKLGAHGRRGRRLS